MAQREQWATRIGVILAVAGSAVGLGNFLRFPGQAAQNGGGAFMIPYFVALLVLGIPLGWAEWTMGRYGGLRGFNSAPGIFSVIWKHPLAKYLAALALLVPLVIYMYYVVIEAWCLGYAWYYLTGELMQASSGDDSYETFFDELRRQERGRRSCTPAATVRCSISSLSRSLSNFVLIYRGVSKGIETFCKLAMPLMAVCAIIVLVRVLTLGTPDPDKPEQIGRQRPGVHVEPQMRVSGQARRPGWPPPGRFSSACRWASASSSTTPATCGRRTTWPSAA